MVTNLFSSKFRYVVLARKFLIRKGAEPENRARPKQKSIKFFSVQEHMFARLHYEAVSSVFAWWGFLSSGTPQ